MVNDSSPPKSRQLLVVVAAVVIASVGALQMRTLLTDPTILKPFDFVEYWSAGHLLLNGENPYDADKLVPIQRSMYDGIKKAVMMWNPPWALPITLPYAALPWRLGQVAWLATQLLSLLVAGDVIWRLYGGSVRRRWIAWVVTLAFAPTVFLLFIGQITGLMVLGLAGFLHYMKKDRPVTAGLFAALTALKPHHLALFGLVLLLDCISNRKSRRAVAAGAIAVAVSGVLPLLWNPHVWQQYREALSRPASDTFEPMEEFAHSTIGYKVRQQVPGEPFAAMFIPLGIAVLATVVAWPLQRRSHSWEERVPPLVVLSVLVTPYGAWAFDMVLLLIPLTQMAVWIVRSGTVALVVGMLGAFLTFGALTVATLTEQYSQANPWIAPIVGVAYAVAAAVRGRWGTNPEETDG